MLATFRKNVMFQRKRIAHKLQNPRIERITFHTLGHLYGIMEYHKNKEIPCVEESLGHRSITSTLIYTHLVNFEGDEYHTATSACMQSKKMRNFSRRGSSMSPKEKASRSTRSENELEVIKHDKEAGEFVVRHRQSRNISRIVDTFAEMLPTLEISPENQTLNWLFRK
jgi:hypothetical protein